MFCKSFEKKANLVKEFGKEIKGQVAGKMNMGMNALSGIDAAKTISAKMKMPLGSPRSA
jgi:hypothetical protein